MQARKINTIPVLDKASFEWNGKAYIKKESKIHAPA
jgi:hypothetical protein